MTKHVVRGVEETHEISIRDAFVAAPGCLLLCADYSQVRGPPLPQPALLSYAASLRDATCQSHHVYWTLT